MGQVVPIPGAEKPAKIRSIFTPALLPFVTLGIYLFFWWYYINREMVDYGKAKRSHELGDSAASTTSGQRRPPGRPSCAQAVTPATG